MGDAALTNWMIGEHGWMNRSRMIDPDGKSAPRDAYSDLMKQWYPEYHGIPKACLMGSNTAMRWMYDCKSFVFTQQYIYPNNGGTTTYSYTFEAFNRILERKYKSQTEMLIDIGHYRIDSPEDPRQQMSFYRRTVLSPIGQDVYAVGPKLIVSFKDPWDKDDYENLLLSPLAVHKSIMFNLDMVINGNEDMWYHRLENPGFQGFTAEIGPDRLIYQGLSSTGVLEINSYERTPW